MATITFPVLPEVHLPRTLRIAQAVRWPWLEDGWGLATFITASIASVASWWYAFQHHLILLYGDAHSHIDIARRVIDNVNPGLAQLGGVWLPLPHLIMEPFVWNDFLWRTGLAGSFSSMLCFLIATMYIYLATRRLTHDGAAAYIGTLVFILNPNILYLQATPLSELVLIATMTASCYYFLAWVQEDQVRYLTYAAVAIFLSTLARYDGWALFLACLVLLVVIGWRKGHSRAKIQGNVLLFGSLGSFGIILWFVWCGIIFGDPLYFQHSQYSAQTQQQAFIKNNLDRTYHNLWLALHDYTVVAIATVGAVFFVLTILAIVVFALRRRLSPEVLATSLFLVPFAFYIVSLFGGQAIIFAPGAAPHGVQDALFNTRYGVGMVAPVAIFIGTLVMRWPLGKIVMVGVIMLQSLVIAQTGIITLQDGQYGISCFPYSTIPVFLARYYTGGYVLNDTYNTRQDIASARIPLSHVLYQGSGALWAKALNNPASVAEWIIVSPGDLIAQHVDLKSKDFTTAYSPITLDPIHRIYLFHRNSDQLGNGRAVSSDLATNDFPLCGSVGHTAVQSQAPARLTDIWQQAARAPLIAWEK